MSRIGKVPISVPNDVKVTIDNTSVIVDGKKGKLSLNIPQGITVKQEKDQLLIGRTSEVKQVRANHGTVRANLRNMIIGLTQGHKKELEIQGVGLRANLQGNKIAFNLGFTHPVEFIIPKGVTVTVPTQTSIIIEGSDRALIGQVAAKIRALKPPEPYKGTGIRYVGEKVKKKQGKSVTK